MNEKHPQGIAGGVTTAGGLLLSNLPAIHAWMQFVGDIIAIAAGAFTLLYYFDKWRQSRADKRRRHSR